MKFRILSPEYKRSRPLANPLTWQVWFAWRPVRLDTSTVAWLENVARRMISATRWRKIGRTMIARPSWFYGPITHVLTQPGVGLDVEYSAHAAQQLNASGGLSAAQAGSAALQGGPVTAPGPYGAGVQPPGSAYVGYPPQGGLNPPAAKPGP